MFHFLWNIYEIFLFLCRRKNYRPKPAKKTTPISCTAVREEKLASLGTIMMLILKPPDTAHTIVMRGLRARVMIADKRQFFII